MSFWSTGFKLKIRSFFYVELPLVESMILRFDGQLHAKLHITYSVTDTNSFHFTKVPVTILAR